MRNNLVMVFSLTACCLSNNLFADGMIEFNPYVGAGVTYDNNVFRFETAQQAKQAGINRLGDRLEKLEVGAITNLNIGSQRFILNSSFTDNSYQRYTFLDNLTKSNSLNWNWALGSKLFGVIGKTRNESAVGFTEARVIQRIIRTTDINTASINWNLMPDLALFAIKDYVELEHDESIFTNFNRKDDINTFGLRYTTPIGNSISTSWKEVKSEFNDRNAQNILFFGESSAQKTKNVSFRWMLTHLLKFSGSLSRVDLTQGGTLGRNFSGGNNNLGLDYALSDSFSIGLSSYRQVTPIDDVAANYIEISGINLNSSWDVTNKIKLQASYLKDEYDFLGNSGLITNAFNTNRRDDVRTWNLGLLYSPIQSTAIQMQYSDSNRESTISLQGYDYQSFNISLRYYFQ